MGPRAAMSHWHTRPRDPKPCAHSAAASRRQKASARTECRARPAVQFGGRQINIECSAASDLALEIKESAVALNNALDGGEAKASSFANFFGGKERLENTVDDLGRDAGPAVLYANQHVRNRF